jgi:hypothetical protein
VAKAEVRPHPLNLIHDGGGVDHYTTPPRHGRNSKPVNRLSTLIKFRIFAFIRRLRFFFLLFKREANQVRKFLSALNADCSTSESSA